MVVIRRSPLAWALLGAMLLWLRGACPDHDAAFTTTSRALIRTSVVSSSASTESLGLGWATLSGVSFGSEAPRRGRPLAAVPEVTAVADGMAVSIGEIVSGLAALYTIMSMNEYIYHRYFQHLGINKLDLSRQLRKTFNLDSYRGDGHVEHHRETLDDMSIDCVPDPTFPFRGTAFPWWATLLMTLSVMMPAFPILSFLGWPGPVIVVTVVAALLLHAMLWNSLHPDMHGLPDVPLTYGVPSLLVDYRDSALFHWLRKNHEGHHRAEGAHGNYNVCCPLADFLVGTYVGEIAPKKIPASA